MAPKGSIGPAQRLGGRETGARFIGSCATYRAGRGPCGPATGFVQQPAVINGASDLLVQIFGEAGRHAGGAWRGGAPLHAAIELELLVHVQSLTHPFSVALSCRRLP